MAVARDIKRRRDRIVSVISNQSTSAGQVYEAMSNAGYLDSDMIVILNDTRHSLQPKLKEVPKRPINALSSILSKVQSSKLFRRFREGAKVLTDILITLPDRNSKSLGSNGNFKMIVHLVYENVLSNFEL